MPGLASGSLGPNLMFTDSDCDEDDSIAIVVAVEIDSENPRGEVMRAREFPHICMHACMCIQLYVCMHVYWPAEQVKQQKSELDTFFTTISTVAGHTHSL